jgi:small GTP-binding protein
MGYSCLILISGHEEYYQLRLRCYPETHVIIICFSLVCPDSYDSVKIIWYRELTNYCPNTPIVLVGTKLDLREDRETVERLRDTCSTEGLSPINIADGMELQKSIGAAKYLECSSLTRTGLNTVFEEAARVGLTNCTTSKKSCELL